jgi:hypothetical protein
MADEMRAAALATRPAPETVQSGTTNNPENNLDRSGAQPLPAFPIVVDEWRKNGREAVRVALDEFKGNPTVDLRVWWLDGKGELKPSRSGLTIGIRHLPALTAAINRAMRQALALGLVERLADDEQGGAE